MNTTRKPETIAEALATNPQPVSGHPGFTIVQFHPRIGLRTKAQPITVLLYEGTEVTRGSKSDLVAILRHAPSKQAFIDKAKGLSF